MSFHLDGFMDELLTLGTEKTAAPRIPTPSPEQLAQLKKGFRGAAGGALASSALYKLVSPDTSLGDAVLGGSSMVGGGRLGSYAARRMGLGLRGRGAASLAGSVAALRLLHRRKKAKKK